MSYDEKPAASPVDEFAPTKLKTARMTIDEARIQVARLLNATLTSACEQMRAAMEKDADKESPEYQNGDLMLKASAEFIAANAILIKRLERPAILRPKRSMKVVRPS